MRHRRALIAIIMALCILVYFYSLTRIPHNTEVLQTSVSNLTPQILFEKQPIIIEEALVDPLALLPTVFKFLAWGKPMHIKGDKGVALRQTRTRYTLISCTSSTGGQADAFHPKYTAVLGTNQAQFITFNLKSHQVLILPKHWWFQVKGQCHIIEISGF